MKKQTPKKQTVKVHAEPEFELDDRMERLSNLETAEDLQKDIQTMYSQAAKIVSKKNNSPKAFLFENALYSMKKPMEETKNISKMKQFQVEHFWNEAYTHLQHINSIN